MKANWQDVTWGVLAVATTGLIAYDFYVAFGVKPEDGGGYEATISARMLESAKKRPIIAFAGGVLVGHLWWNQNS